MALEDMQLVSAYDHPMDITEYNDAGKPRSRRNRSMVSSQNRHVDKKTKKKKSKHNKNNKQNIFSMPLDHTHGNTTNAWISTDCRSN